MHWSRLVDAPIAALMLAAKCLRSQAYRRIVALSYGRRLFSSPLSDPASGYRLSGEETMFPPGIIGGTTLFYFGIFAPAPLIITTYNSP